MTETLRAGPGRPFHICAHLSRYIPMRGVANCGFTGWRTYLDSERVEKIGGRICVKCLNGPTPQVQNLLKEVKRQQIVLQARLFTAHEITKYFGQDK